MASILVLGLIVSILLSAIYVYFEYQNKSRLQGISWKKSIVSGLKIFVFSLLAGSISTYIVQNIREHRQFEFSLRLFTEIIALFLYAVVFTLLLVLPALIISIKWISKTSFTLVYKELIFSSINFILVILINVVMGGFAVNTEFLFFLSGFSVCGIVIPLIICKLDKIFVNSNEMN